MSMNSFFNNKLGDRIIFSIRCIQLNSKMEKNKFYTHFIQTFLENVIVCFRDSQLRSVFRCNKSEEDLSQY